MQKLDQRLSWIYLGNLIFYFIPVLYVPYSIAEIALILLAVPPFVVCYFAAHRHRSNRQQMLAIVGMALVASAITPLNQGSTAMFSFVAFFLGATLPLRRFIAAIGTLILLITALYWQLAMSSPLFLFYGIGLSLGLGWVGVVTRLKEINHQQEQRSADEIKQWATLLERERIARDLHDIMGHSLSSIVLKAELAEKLLQQQQLALAQQHLKELTQIARDSLSQIRQTVSGYKHKGLAGELKVLQQKLQEGNFLTHITGTPPSLSARAETATILILTELVTNILRHSNGNCADLIFAQDDRHWTLQLSDNGQLSSLTLGNGLLGIQQRLAALNGNFQWRLTPGFCALIQLPLEEILS